MNFTIVEMDRLLAVDALAWSGFNGRIFTPPSSLYLLVTLILLAFLAGAADSMRRASDQTEKIAEVHYGWPVIGNVIGYSKNPISFLRKATAQYGSMFKTDMIFTSVIWLRSPSLNKLYLGTKEVRSNITHNRAC